MEFSYDQSSGALGLAQLERLDKFIEKKRWIGNMYNELLFDSPNILLPLKEIDYAKNIYWVYGLVLDKKLEVSANKIMGDLKNQGIGCRPFFYPMHKQPVLNKKGLFKKESYPIAEMLYEKGLYLPSGLAITEDQIKRVSTVLKNIIQK